MIQSEQLKIQQINVSTKECPLMISIGDYWDNEMLQQATSLFSKYKDVFTWLYQDLKGVPQEVGEH